MSYCPTHGRFDDYFDRGCPSCRSIEEQAKLDREEILDSTYQIARALTNLGDYVCPHCRQTSLKSGASRCPLCRGVIGADYWEAVRVLERAQDEARAVALKIAAEQQRVREEEAAAEYERTAPQRAAASAKAAEEAQRRRRNHASNEYASIGAFLGGIVMGFAGCASCLSTHYAVGEFPVTPFNLLTGLLLGVVIGAIIGSLIGQMKE